MVDTTRANIDIQPQIQIVYVNLNWHVCNCINRWQFFDLFEYLASITVQQKGGGFIVKIMMILLVMFSIGEIDLNVCEI